MFQTSSTLLYLAPQAERARENWPCVHATGGTRPDRLRPSRLASQVSRVARAFPIPPLHIFQRGKQLRFGDILLFLLFTCIPVESEWLFVPNSITPPALYFNMTKLGAWSNTVDYIEVRQVGYQGLTGQRVKTFDYKSKTAKI